MNGGDWASVASAVIAFAAMIGSGVGWLLARKANKTAVEQATRAVHAAEDAAGHAGRAADAEERVASVVEAQERREAESVDAAQADPWELAPIPGDDDVYLINRTSTPKYGVRVSGYKVHNGLAHYEKVGAGKRVEVSIMRILDPDDGAESTTSV